MHSMTNGECKNNIHRSIIWAEIQLSFQGKCFTLAKVPSDFIYCYEYSGTQFEFLSASQAFQLFILPIRTYQKVRFSGDKGRWFVAIRGGVRIAARGTFFVFYPFALSFLHMNSWTYVLSKCSPNVWSSRHWAGLQEEPQLQDQLFSELLVLLFAGPVGFWMLLVSRRTNQQWLGYSLSMRLLKMCLKLCFTADNMVQIFACTRSNFFINSI